MIIKETFTIGISFFSFFVFILKIFSYSNNKLTKLAINTGKDIVIEDLNFLETKSKTMKGKSTKGKQYNKMLHSLAYRFFIDRMKQICHRKNVGLIKVNPAWTSWIAKNNYCNQMKLNIHTGASFVIARRGMGIKDVV